MELFLSFVFVQLLCTSPLLPAWVILSISCADLLMPDTGQRPQQIKPGSPTVCITQALSATSDRSPIRTRLRKNMDALARPPENSRATSWLQEQLHRRFEQCHLGLVSPSQFTSLRVDVVLRCLRTATRRCLGAIGVHFYQDVSFLPSSFQRRPGFAFVD